MNDMRVERLRCEHLRDARGIDRPRPRLSWHVVSDRRGTRQTAYQVLAATSPELLVGGTADLWDTGKVSSAECVLIPYAGPELISRAQVFWTVRVWDERDVPSPLAPVATWEMGLLVPADWQAQWICAAGPPGPSEVTYLRSRLPVEAPVLRARAYVTALGLYELRCNGRRAGDARFTPGWTDYHQRLQYQVLDLTDLLHAGENTITVLLADGWYAGYVGFLGQRQHYGDVPELLAQIEVVTTRGRTVHASGSGWESGRGPVLRSDMLLGETVDLRLDEDGDAWEPAGIGRGSSGRRVLSAAPPVRVLDELAPASVVRVGADTHRVDFGQNLVGWVRARLAGEAGSRVTIRHAEVLQPDGSLYVENLRGAAATEEYVHDGLGPRVVEPIFTFHGFRYAEVTGHPGDLSPADLTAVVCGSDLEQVGTFSCSDERVQRLHDNIVWGARGNFLDIPTDCPQRDERMGWTGDAQVFARTACYLFDTAAFFAKWLRDLTDAQTSEGSFPDVAPRVVLAPEGSAGWADAGVVVPWTLWETYGDKELLGEHFPAMRAWVNYVHRANPDLLWLHSRGYDNGDWLCVGSATDKDLIATAYFALSTRLTARAADVLGHGDETDELHSLADAIADAFRAAYLLPDGRLRCGTQTAYALALRFGLVPEDLAGAAAAHLVADVEAHRNHLTTGFLGVGQLLPALSDAGRGDLAYRLLLQDDFPSWLQAVGAGATTVWERWDGWTAEGGYGDPAMNSYNHYALGSVGEWLYRSAAGIEPTRPGGRELCLSPTPTRLLSRVMATHVCPYGLVQSGWAWVPDGGLRVEVRVPVGCSATLVVPAPADAEVTESGCSLADAAHVSLLHRDAGCVLLELGSGSYAFEVSRADTPAAWLPTATLGPRHARI